MGNNKNRLSKSPGNKIASTQCDIIILVGGTVDPLNISVDKKSNSYRDSAKAQKLDNNHYWEFDEHFKKILETEFKEKYYNLHFFKYLGWSGDNSKAVREETGTSLAQRLCGSGGKSPYYPKFLTWDVSFHLIGHSHGGNVIHEFTKQIAKDEKWPDKWKIKSITYLSTPFFKNIHKPDTAKFHDDCKIISVYNKYDLTQRVIADFTLYQLSGVVEEFKNQDMANQLDKILEFDHTVLQPLISPPRLTRDGWIPKLDWHLSIDEGNRIYRECEKLFKNIKNLLNMGILTIIKLNKIKIQSNKSKTIVSDSLKNILTKKAENIIKGLDKTIQAFETRRKKNVYPRMGVLEDLDIGEYMVILNQLIEINANTLDGPIPELLYELLNSIMSDFDDTENNCSHLYNDKFKNSIISIDVTEVDEYHNKRDSQFSTFINNLKNSERRFSSNKSHFNLLDLAFNLIAELAIVHKNLSKLGTTVNWLGIFLESWDKIDILLGLENTAFEDELTTFHTTLKNYHKILTDRDAGGIVVQEDTSQPKMGDIDYLSRISHSISRNQLFSAPKGKKLVKKLINEWHNIIDTPLRSNVR